MKTFLKEISASESKFGNDWEVVNENGKRWIVMFEDGTCRNEKWTFVSKEEAMECARQCGEYSGEWVEVAEVKEERKVKIQQHGKMTAEGHKLLATFSDTKESAGYVVGYTEEWTAVRLNGERFESKRLKDCRKFLATQ